jgi:sucrose-6-phosphate hydrolase SacC (GH32 family)
MVEVEFEVKSAKDFGVKIAQLKDKKDDKKFVQETIVGYNVRKQQLYLDRRKSGKIIQENFASVEIADMKMQGKTVKMKILVDKTSVEVFGNDGRVTISDLIFPEEQSSLFSLFTNGGKVKVKSLKISDLEK